MKGSEEPLRSRYRAYKTAEDDFGDLTLWVKPIWSQAGGQIAALLDVPDALCDKLVSHLEACILRLKIKLTSVTKKIDELASGKSVLC